MNKKIKKIIPLIIFLLLTIYYFEYAVTITYDSAHYMNYVNILERISPLSSWDVVRGPIFPMIIFFGNILFGKTTQGLLMNTYIYYLLMLLFNYIIIKIIFDNIKINKKKEKIISLIIMLIIIINPIIYGFYHTLLTEFVAITLSSLSCVLSYLWLNIDIEKEKKKYILYTVLFIVLTIYSWFLKQPYVSCGFFSLFIAYIISILEKRNSKSFLYRTITVISCVIFLIISMKCWDVLLEKTGNNPNTDRNPTNSLGNQVVNAVDYLVIDNTEEIFEEEYINNSKLSDKEKKEVKEMIDEDKEYVIVNIYEDNKYTDSDYIKSSDGQVSSPNSIIYVLKSFIKNPLKLLKCYIFNYLSIIDISPTVDDGNVGYLSTNRIDFNFSNEISTIAFRPYYNMSNIFPMPDEMAIKVDSYKQQNINFSLLNKVMIIFGYIFLYVFRIVNLLLPFNLIYCIIKRTRKNISNNDKKIYNFLIIIFGFSFLHILLHAITGAIIDRYAIPVFAITIIATIMLLINKFKRNFA